MRIFVGLDLDPAIRQRIQRFLEGVSAFAPEARWVRPESLHITLKFIGEQTAEQVEAIKHVLSKVEAPGFEIALRGWGFFPPVKAPRVFWIGMDGPPALAGLAAAIDAATASLGIPAEERAFSPHLTLARSGRGASGAPGLRKGYGPNPVFQMLQKRLGQMAEVEFGTMAAREFFLYQSQLGAGGSKYSKLEKFELL